MTLDAAIRLTELCLGLALLQQSLEHLRGPQKDRVVFTIRIAFATLLAAGVQAALALAGLAALSLLILRRFQGPYNGGADRMGVLAIWCLLLAHTLPEDPLLQPRSWVTAVDLLVSCLGSLFHDGEIIGKSPSGRSVFDQGSKTVPGPGGLPRAPEDGRA